MTRLLATNDELYSRILIILSSLIWLSVSSAAGLSTAGTSAGLPLETGLQHGEAWHQPEDVVQKPIHCGQSSAAGH